MYSVNVALPKYQILLASVCSYYYDPHRDIPMISFNSGYTCTCI